MGRKISPLDMPALRVIANGPLSVLVQGFSLRFADGSVASVPDTTVAVEDGRVNHIMVDLHDLSLHSFRRAYHTGGVFIAAVTTAAGAITSISGANEIPVPRTYVGKTKAKQKRANQPITGALIGDSTTDGGGSGTNWRSLVFDAGEVASGLNVSSVSQFTVTNYAIGSATARMGLAMLGRATPGAGSGAHWWGTSFKRDVGRRISDPPGRTDRSSILSRQTDFATVMFGANGGTDAIGHIENQVRELRRRGVEVIILAQQVFAADANNSAAALWTMGDDLKRIADAYGCEFVDACCYMLEQNALGNNPWADSIHANQVGKTATAKALRSVLNDRSQEARPPQQLPSGRIITSLSTSPQFNYRFPATAETEFAPYATAGSPSINQAGSVNSAAQNPAMGYGGKTLATSVCVQLSASGHIAYFDHPHWLSADLLVDTKDGNFSVEVWAQSVAEPLGTLTYTGGVLNRVQCLELVSMATLQNSSNAFNGGGLAQSLFANGGVQLKWVSGTCNVLGIVFHTFRNRALPWQEVERYGTWGWDSSSSYLGAASMIPYTDTTGDMLAFRFKGIGAHVSVGSKSATGKVDGWIDGRQIYSDLDLYRAGGTYIIDLPFFPAGIAVGDGAADEEHDVVLKLKAANVSAAGASAGNRRLALYDVREFYSH